MVGKIRFTALNIRVHLMLEFCMSLIIGTDEFTFFISFKIIRYFFA